MKKLRFNFNNLCHHNNTPNLYPPSRMQAPHLPYLRLAVFSLWLGALGSLQAHQPGESYLALRIQENHVEGGVHINITDLDEKFDLDTSGDGLISEAELNVKIAEAASYVNERVSISSGGRPLQLDYSPHKMQKLTLGQYVIFPFRTPDLPSVPDLLDIGYNVLFDVDPDHRGRVIMEYNAKTGEVNNVERISLDFYPGDGEKTLDLTLKYSPLRELMRFIWEGVWHIWIGLDHILFLAALLLPAVLLLQGKRWEPVENFQSALWNVIKIVTCFTIAHSITLSLAALGIVSLSSRVVESIIALSVLLAALNNIFPLVKQHVWLIVFLFGLFHGFGFASVFGDLLSDDALTIPLVGFNVGVELGQVAIILALFPILYFLRNHRNFYVKGILYGGSIIIALLSAKWFVERAFNLG